MARPMPATAQIDGKADARHGPDAGGGGKSLGIEVAVAVDDTGAEEADAADYLRSDPGRIPAPNTGEEEVALREIGEAVLGDDHQKGGRTGHDTVGPDTGVLEAAAPLQADDRAADSGDDDSEKKLCPLSNSKVVQQKSVESHRCPSSGFRSPAVPLRSAVCFHCTTFLYTSHGGLTKLKSGTFAKSVQQALAKTERQGYDCQSRHPEGCPVFQKRKKNDMVHLTPLTFLIVCPMVFLAGFVDSIGGGGGLISLPAYLFAGLPIHQTVATNKLSACFGTGTATLRFARQKLVRPQLVLPTVAAAAAGSAIGARISLILSERVLLIILLCVLPVVAFAVTTKVLKDRPRESEVINTRTCVTATIAAFVIGMYDGIYGPGTGTFLIIALTIFSKLSIVSANAHTKAINLTSNVISLVIFLRSGTVVIPLGLAAAVCNMAGAYLGSGMVMEKGSKIVRPILAVVLALLFIKVLGELIT